MIPHHRHCSALAHKRADAESVGTPRRSVGRSFQTPRDGRYGDRFGRPGTLPPVPGRTAFLCAGLLFLLFGLLTWQEAVHGRLLALDGPLRTAIAGESVRPVGSPPGHFFADLGNAAVALPVLGAALAFAVRRGRRAALRHWWLPPLGYALAIPLIVSPLKAAIGRGGPGSLALSPGYPGLFPSGHAATATLAYGAAALLVLPWVRSRAARRALGGAVVLGNLAVGVALVYCGYHWPLDVLGSWLLCGGLLCLSFAGSGRSGGGTRCRRGG
jgi:membrane-associated phospholipid phosphatase